MRPASGTLDSADSGRSIRRRVEGTSGATSRGVREAELDDEDPPTALNEGRDPAIGDRQMQRAGAELFDGTVACDDGERRAYLLLEVETISEFFARSVTRERENSLLISWDFIRLLSPDWYTIVFKLSCPQLRFRAVPDSMLSLEGYPAASRSPKDPERQKGFTSQKELRLVLYPNALRFFWGGLFVPLREAGVWPTPRQILQQGWGIPAAAWSALSARVDRLGQSAESEPAWLPGMRADLLLRYQPAAVAASGADDPAAPTTVAQPATTSDALRAVRGPVYPASQRHSGIGVPADFRSMCSIVKVAFDDDAEDEVWVTVIYSNEDGSEDEPFSVDPSYTFEDLRDDAEGFFQVQVRDVELVVDRTAVPWPAAASLYHALAAFENRDGTVIVRVIAAECECGLPVLAAWDPPGCLLSIPHLDCHCVPANAL